MPHPRKAPSIAFTMLGSGNRVCLLLSPCLDLANNNCWKQRLSSVQTLSPTTQDASRARTCSAAARHWEALPSGLRRGSSSDR
jgi:hypothetical protein